MDPFDGVGAEAGSPAGALRGPLQTPPDLVLRRGGYEPARRPTGCAKWAGARASAPRSCNAGRGSSRRARSCTDDQWRRSPDIGRRCARGTRRRRARTRRGERTGGGRKPLVGNPAGRWRVVVLGARDAKRCRARGHNIVIRPPGPGTQVKNVLKTGGWRRCGLVSTSIRFFWAARLLRKKRQPCRTGT